MDRLKTYSVGILIIILLLPYFFFIGFIFTSPVSTEGSVAGIAPRIVEPRPYGKILIVNPINGNFTSISQAVRSANPGDTIVVERGIYHEEVYVNKSWITIRGVDSKDVILDGQFTLIDGITAVNAYGVTVANLTVRNYLRNGIVFIKSYRWVMDGIISINNRVYGLYALSSKIGVMKNDIASGSGDSGFYIGEVFDCNCVIDNSTAYANTLGYSGTRANGVVIKNSRFVNNPVGVAPNTLLPDIQLFITGRWLLPLYASNHTIINNVIENNNNRTVKGVGFSATYGVPIGTGIALIGSFGNTVAGNIIKENGRWGISEWFFFAPPIGNRYDSNLFVNNGQDFWNDGTNIGSCSSNELASGDVPFPCYLPFFLRLYLPNPLKEAELITSVERPGSSSTSNYSSYALIPAIPFMLLGIKFIGISRARRIKRVTSALIDGIFVGDLYLLVMSLVIILNFGSAQPSVIVDGVESITLLLAPLSYFVFVTIWFLYGLSAEMVSGRTLGKKIMNLKVVSRDGGKPSIIMIVVKSLIRYIDALLVGLIWLIFILIRGRSLSKLVSGTIVIESK